MCVLAQVALPEIQEVHVVDRRFPPLHFEQDARCAEPQKVVGTYRTVVAIEEPSALIDEAEVARKIQEDLLDPLARGPWLVCRSDPSLRIRCLEMSEERTGDFVYPLRLRRCGYRLLDKGREFDGHSTMLAHARHRRYLGGRPGVDQGQAPATSSIGRPLVFGQCFAIRPHETCRAARSVAKPSSPAPPFHLPRISRTYRSSQINRHPQVRFFIPTRGISKRARTVSVRDGKRKAHPPGAWCSVRGRQARRRAPSRKEKELSCPPSHRTRPRRLP